MSPRSILKNSHYSHRSSNYTPEPEYYRTRHSVALPYADAEHRVHFPPTPSLTTLHVADPPSTYDRTPILVLPNVCALPARGCPGRTYSPPAPSCSGRSRSQSSHAHPSAFASYPNALGINTSPALISDDGSSEESDAPTTPPPECASYNPLASYPSYPSRPLSPSKYSQSELDFLPYAPPSIPSSRSVKLGKSERRKSPRPASFRAAAWGADLACLGGF
ncbi:hypothetical protein BOTBODRAFT_180214 [Botryobasidium botryosum FD-172 SS1]|uniref:Uncharacterized protein n=1 Tax=Botryobasidium botryosum (strain FD-172 SS1) TaxID=930990 RepID=A0A067M878_BOTB1|nr:hypothetical protein BOTBODRAFT_180214 [Botryobasidium botryosum FD-172 SS1]